MVPDLASCQDQGACAISRVVGAGLGRMRRRPTGCAGGDLHQECSGQVPLQLFPLHQEKTLSTLSPSKNKEVSVPLTSDYHVTTHEGLVPLFRATIWGY